MRDLGPVIQTKVLENNYGVDPTLYSDFGGKNKVLLQ
jgi:hypothetical protein